MLCSPITILISLSVLMSVHTVTSYSIYCTYIMLCSPITILISLSVLMSVNTVTSYSIYCTYIMLCSTITILISLSVLMSVHTVTSYSIYCTYIMHTKHNKLCYKGLFVLFFLVYLNGSVSILYEREP